MPKFNTTQLVAFIKAHAITNYAKGWDVVVETYDDAQIAETLGNASSHKAAIAAFSGIVGAFNEQRDMHRNEALLMGAEPTRDEIDSGKVKDLLGTDQVLDDSEQLTPTLGTVLKNLTDLEKRVLIAHLDAGIDCNGAETLDAMRADNMTWADVAEVSQRTGLTKNQLKGVIASVSSKGLLDPNCEKPNGAKGVDQVLTDWGVVVAFELLADGVIANPAPAPKPAPKVKPAPAPKKARVVEDRVLVQPATDLKFVKPTNEGTKRHLLAQALLRGATVDHLVEVLGWNKSTVTSALRWDIKEMGLGVERKGDKYFLILPEGVKAIPVRAKDVTRAAALVAACK